MFSFFIVTVIHKPIDRFIVKLKDSRFRIVHPAGNLFKR